MTDYQRIYDAAIRDMADKLSKAALRMSDDLTLKSARRELLALAADAHRLTADIIEAELFTGAPQWEGNQ